MFEEASTAVGVFTPVIQLDPHLVWPSGQGVGLSLKGRGMSSGVDLQIQGGTGTGTEARVLVLTPPQQTWPEP